MGHWPINRRCANKLCAYGCSEYVVNFALFLGLKMNLIKGAYIIMQSNSTFWIIFLRTLFIYA